MDRDTVRLLIPDLGTDENQIFTDSQIEAFLALNDGDVRLAAADALEVVASDEILTYKITRNDDHSVNGVTGAEALLERAAKLREQAFGSADEFTVVYPHAHHPLVPEATARPWWAGC